MKQTSLVIMAAGIGSRFGGGIKQLEPVGPNGEIIMDYSIHDALEAGFNKIIFIIRKDLERILRRSSETGSKRWLRWNMHSRRWMTCRRDLQCRRAGKSPGERDRPFWQPET